MARTVLIDGTTYSYPSDGEPAGWGAEASDAFVALTEVVTSLSGANDIAKSSATVTNNVVVATNIVGLAFNSAVVFGAVITYHVKRTSSSARAIETGQIILAQDSATTPKWSFTKLSSGSGGLTFSITDAGQFQYISTNISGTSYLGTITFSARAFP